MSVRANSCVDCVIFSPVKVKVCGFPVTVRVCGFPVTVRVCGFPVTVRVCGFPVTGKSMSKSVDFLEFQRVDVYTRTQFEYHSILTRPPCMGR